MASDQRQELERLRARVNELEQQLQKAGPRRQKIDQMSAEVIDSNPYRCVYIQPYSLYKKKKILRIKKE